MLKLIILFFILIILFVIIDNKNNLLKEHFVESNFSLCKKNDCKCLKMNRAPDGTCIVYKTSPPPLIPSYKNKKIYKPFVVRNNKFPLKKNRYILIFLGRKIRKQEESNEDVPDLLKFMYKKKDDEPYSEDKKTQYLMDVFLNAIDVFDLLGDEKKPFIKYLILDNNKKGYEQQVMSSYGLKEEDKNLPKIYLYNQKINKLFEFKYDESIKNNRCLILQELIIFVADSDCGLISYLNHLQDPFLGIKYKHNSRTNEWEESDKGVRLADGGTTMCKLIDYENLPKNFKCK